MPLDYPITMHTLDNGMRVVVSEDHLVPHVSINLWVDVGSRHECPGTTGLAHLFEHLMFEGSEHVAEGEHFRALSGHGGQCNATTSFDRTTYVESLPTGAFELALWLEADRHRRLLPALTQANLDNQRDVVVQEKHQRYDNQPYGDAFQQMCQAVFPPGHPYRHTPIGDLDDLRGASLEQVHGFYRDHYGARTSTLSVTGDVHPETVVDLAQRHFAGPDDRSVPRRDLVAPLEPIGEPAWTPVAGSVPCERSYTCFRLPAVTERAFVATALALDVLAGLAVSPLHRRLVRQDETATACGAAGLGLVEGTSLAYLAVDVASGSSAEVVDAAVCEELGRLAQDGPTPVQHRAAVAGADRSHLETLADTDERAEVLARSTVLHGDPQHLNTYLDLVRSVSAEEIAQAAARWLSPASRAVLVYGGAGSLPDAVTEEGAA